MAGSAIEGVEAVTVEREVSISVDSPGRIPALDGVRAIAITFVLVEHLFYGHGVLGITGPFGVTLFLVLSGFLITSVMLEDERRSGRLRLGRFYWRRAWRILPALYVYLSVVAVLVAAEWIGAPSVREWIGSVFYVRNFGPFTHWPTTHLWSLSLEEQFYSCWPVLFILTKGFRLKFIAVAVLAFTIVRMFAVHAGVVSHSIYPFIVSPFYRLDTFLIGGAFAIARWNWPARIHGPLVALLLMAWFPLSFAYRATQPLATPVSAFLIGVLIIWAIKSESLASRLLSGPIPVLIGQLSYSIYLWQQLFTGRPFPYWWSLPAIAITAAASYYLVERPCLKFKARFPTRKASKLTHRRLNQQTA